MLKACNFQAKASRVSWSHCQFSAQKQHGCAHVPRLVFTDLAGVGVGKKDSIPQYWGTPLQLLLLLTQMQRHGQPSLLQSPPLLQILPSQAKLWLPGDLEGQHSPHSHLPTSPLYFSFFPFEELNLMTRALKYNCTLWGKLESDCTCPFESLRKDIRRH